MIIEYTLHMPFWSRVKVLFGVGVRVRVDADAIRNIAVCARGEEGNLKTVLSIPQLDANGMIDANGMTSG